MKLVLLLSFLLLLVGCVLPNSIDASNTCFQSEKQCCVNENDCVAFDPNGSLENFTTIGDNDRNKCAEGDVPVFTTCGSSCKPRVYCFGGQLDIDQHLKNSADSIFSDSFGQDYFDKYIRFEYATKKYGRFSSDLSDFNVTMHYSINIPSIDEKDAYGSYWANQGRFIQLSLDKNGDLTIYNFIQSLNCSESKKCPPFEIDRYKALEIFNKEVPTNFGHTLKAVSLIRISHLHPGLVKLTEKYIGYVGYVWLLNYDCVKFCKTFAIHPTNGDVVFT